MKAVKKEEVKQVGFKPGMKATGTCSYGWAEWWIDDKYATSSLINLL